MYYTDEDAERIMNSLSDREARMVKRYGENVMTTGRIKWMRRIIDTKCNGNPAQFDQEYPSDEVECFMASGTAIFDMAGLQYQRSVQTAAIFAPTYGIISTQEGRSPIFIPTEERQALFRVWDPPQAGFSHLLSADFMRGRMSAGAKGKLDAHSFSVWRAEMNDRVTGERHKIKKVAAIMPESRVHIDIACSLIAMLAAYYGDCMVIPEINNMGDIITPLKNAGVKTIWRQSMKGEEGQPFGTGKTQVIEGWTTTAGSRFSIISHLEKMIREQEFICSDPETLEQYTVFIRLPDGRTEAAPGFHDDNVIESGIGLYNINSATPYIPPGNVSTAVPYGGWEEELDPRGL